MSTSWAYKRSPALTNSTWYNGILVSEMAGTADNNGAFDFAISKVRRGTEPSPHVHSREDEFFYVLSGEMRVYVDGEVFEVTAGECMFLPRRKPHAFLITSEEAHVILLVRAYLVCSQESYSILPEHLERLRKVRFAGAFILLIASLKPTLGRYSAPCV